MHNNQRDGLHRQAIARGRVAYEPNSLGGGCPFQAGAAGFASFPKAIEPNNAPIDKVRGKPEKFAEHYAQAKLFFESQTDVEKAHIKGAFRFELSKLTVPAIRVRVISSLLNVSKALASELAKDLGLELPDPMPRAMKNAPKAEVSDSPALSLKALPGDGSIATRKIAILLADGVEAGSDYGSDRGAQWRRRGHPSARRAAWVRSAVNRASHWKSMQHLRILPPYFSMRWYCRAAARPWMHCVSMAVPGIR